MYRIDNTHATFLNCLRDWDDPFLHGHKQAKSLGCERCESCGCRFKTTQESNNLNPNKEFTLSDNNLNSLNESIDSHRSCRYESFRKSSRNSSCQGRCGHAPNNKIQPMVRCKSTINVPKTIDQCIRLAKSRPRPSSIKPRATFTSGHLINDAMLPKRNTNAKSIIINKLKTANKEKIIVNSKFGSNNSKISTNSIESDKESSDAVSKDDDYKALYDVSSPEISITYCSTNSCLIKGTFMISNF